MDDAPPRTWADVPGAVRTALAAPLVKYAEGVAVLSPAADVLGWRAGDLNAWRGGPRPLTNLLVGAGLGSLGGYGVGRLAEELLPGRYFTPGAVRRRGALLGAALGSVVPLWQASDNVRRTGELSSVLDPWPPEVVKGSADLFDPVIAREEFNRAVWADPNTPPPLRAATAGLVEAASSIRGSDLISPWDVGKIAVGAGAGLISGVIAGKALGLLAGLTPEAQQGVQRVGLWAGLLKSTVPQALGLERGP